MSQRRSWWRAVRADVWRCQGRYSLWALCRTWVQDPAFRPVFTLRLVQRCRGVPVLLPVLLFALLWHRRTQRRCGVDLPTRLRVGAGFKLAHGWGVVINADSHIGRNVTVMQGVTIGGSESGVPVLDDDVIVCANATVIGAVRLGRGCVVGAGCVVTKDVPAHATVVGNPQRMVERRSSPRGYNPVPASELD